MAQIKRLICQDSVFHHLCLCLFFDRPPLWVLEQKSSHVIGTYVFTCCLFVCFLSKHFVLTSNLLCFVKQHSEIFSCASPSKCSRQVIWWATKQMSEVKGDGCRHGPEVRGRFVVSAATGWQSKHTDSLSHITFPPLTASNGFIFIRHGSFTPTKRWGPLSHLSTRDSTGNVQRSESRATVRTYTLRSVRGSCTIFFFYLFLRPLTVNYLYLAMEKCDWILRISAKIFSLKFIFNHKRSLLVSFSGVRWSGFWGHVWGPVCRNIWLAQNGGCPWQIACCLQNMQQGSGNTTHNTRRPGASSSHWPPCCFLKSNGLNSRSFAFISQSHSLKRHCIDFKWNRSQPGIIL